MVQRDQFTESVTALGLLSKPADEGATASGGPTTSKTASTSKTSSAPKYAQVKSCIKKHIFQITKKW
jgi:heme-binding NEAT domain protein